MGDSNVKTETNLFNICVQGCGGFAEWAMDQYTQLGSVKIHSLVDRHIEKAIWCARRHGAEHYYDHTQDCMTGDVDLVYIATPPYVHYEQTDIALEKGKHVLVEKPPAMTKKETEKLVQKAEKKNLRLQCNFVMRYNPYYNALREVVKSGILGKVNSFAFKNYAQNIPEDSWFWKKDLCGGIFIEHGVHFFDVMNSILGKGKTIQSYTIKRQGHDFEDRYFATVMYPGNIPGSFYHSFTQEQIIERNYLYVAFERGYLVLYEWIPTAMTGEVWVSPEDYIKLHKLLFEHLPQHTDLTVDTMIEKMDEEEMNFGEVCIEADEIVEIEDKLSENSGDIEAPWGPLIRERHYSGPRGELFNFKLYSRIEEGKPAVYSECTRKCMADLVEGILNPDHKMVISGEDLVNCMEVAEDAEKNKLIFENY
jgi:predicted dehydrogenase